MLTFVNGIPQSDADNAYDLCYDAARCIREEPRRYHQGEWMCRRGDTVGPFADEAYPACGTIACRAGWLVVLAGHPTATLTTVVDQCSSILGRGKFEWDRNRDYAKAVDALFSGDAVDSSLGFGTPAYAEAGAAGLERFAEQWKERLVATPIRRDADANPEATPPVA